MEACGVCNVCQSVKNGNNQDIVEMDAASHNGVEEIRNIRDGVKFSPVEGKYKVYIVDEVHMLSTGAFNAFLKTLEEPPGHAIFILATTEIHKIPATIISRCQRFDFKRISQGSLVQHLTKVAEAEDFDVEEEAFHAIARSAQGGMRDALGTLEQAMNYSSGTLTLEEVNEVTGNVSQHFLSETIKSFRENRWETLLTIVSDVINKGNSPENYINDLMICTQKGTS